MRLNRYISNCGYCSRREADRLIVAESVRVNGEVVSDFSIQINDGDLVEVKGDILKLPTHPRLWLYHKPRGLITSRVGQMGRQTIFQALPGDMPRVISIGRLDYNTEGLLILTNDGKITYYMSLPGLVRKYRVRAYLKERVDDFADRVLQIEKGVTIAGIEYGAVKITPSSKNNSNRYHNRGDARNSWFDVELYEGKNREIRYIFGYIGMVVNRLIRKQYGPFLLGDLKSGMVRELRYEDFSKILKLPEFIRQQ
jgi:23S rRNA pseudouridine2605 synthase